jgi:HicA-like toxin of HicAB toxin-antitoxin system
MKVRDVIRLIEDDGWTFHRQKGSHREVFGLRVMTQGDEEIPDRPLGGGEVDRTRTPDDPESPRLRGAAIGARCDVGHPRSGPRAERWLMACRLVAPRL